MRARRVCENMDLGQANGDVLDAGRALRGDGIAAETTRGKHAEDAAENSHYRCCWLVVVRSPGAPLPASRSFQFMIALKPSV